ncbi:MAG TPA: HAD-IIIA family hydrolase [Tepidisphaeraceae bacterium]|nr:HAD-IIIA family hydrolase [Tepidisphaeraceae bacterium]
MEQASLNSRPAIFFDRDNTLIVNDGYLSNPEHVHLIPGAADAVARAHELGYAVVIASNQSGVARGFFTEESVRQVNQRMDQLLLQANPRAIIDRHEYCPFHPEGTIERYRQSSNLCKPRPGMLLRAAALLNLDLKKSWMIGDSPRDIEAGKAAGCRTILLRLGDVKPSPAAIQESRVQPVATAGSLSEAMEIIARGQ